MCSGFLKRLFVSWHLHSRHFKTSSSSWHWDVRKGCHGNFVISHVKLQISNGNRTEWSPVRSVIIRVINKIGRPRSGSPICLITSMITDRIGRHEVLLPVNHNFNKICDIIGYFLNQNKRNSKFWNFAPELRSNSSPMILSTLSAPTDKQSVRSKV